MNILPDSCELLQEVQMLSGANAISLMEEKFYPMRVDAEIRDYGQILRFRVFRSDGKHILGYRRINLAKVYSLRMYHVLLADIRRQLLPKQAF